MRLSYLKALFNFGIKKGMINHNPVQGLVMLPEEKKRKYIPSSQDIQLVIAAANNDTQDYLLPIRDTMGRVSEMNGLKWDDINLKLRTVTLYTSKKRGGHRTPRVIPMTARLFEVMCRRHRDWDEKKPWVFWHRYWDRKGKQWVEGPYHNRHKLMRTLCDRAGVRRFGFHALRHAGASLLDQQRVPLGTIQKILGHENRQTTEIYLHSIGESERAAMAAFERASGMGENRESHPKSHPNPHPNGSSRPGPKLVRG